MFTFKKIALLGVASLTALAMSCSDGGDSDGADVGAITDLKINDSKDGILLGGTITANDDFKVKAVTATADGKEVKINKLSNGKSINEDLPKTTVSLDGAYLAGVCGDKKGVNKFKIIIKAEFNDNDNTSISSDSKEVEVNCGGEDVAPSKGTYTLSSAGESYLDVDEGKTYKKSQLTSSNKEDIDLVAYQAGSASGDKIYSPCYATGGAITYDECGEARIFKTKKDLDDADEDDEGEESIALTSTTVFYLESSELDPFKVSVTALGGNSVTLKVEPVK